MLHLNVSCVKLFQVALHFAIGVTLLYGFPFIIYLFSFAETDLYLGQVFFIEIQPERDKCVSFLF